MKYQVTKQIILDLLFEHYTSALCVIKLEEATKKEMTSHGEIQLSGGITFEIVFKILGIKLNNINHSRYYTPFKFIIERKPETIEKAKKEILIYYNWLMEDSEYWKELELKQQ